MRRLLIRFLFCLLSISLALGGSEAISQAGSKTRSSAQARKRSHRRLLLNHPGKAGKPKPFRHGHVKKAKTRLSLKKRRSGAETTLSNHGVNPGVARFVASYYARIDKVSKLERVIRQGGLLRNGDAHASGFATHGLTHVTNIVSNVDPVLKSLSENGTIKKRRGTHKKFVRELALQLAALHDIGNAVDGFSAAARKDHRQFAAQVTMTAAFDGVVRSVRQGPIGTYLEKNRKKLNGQSVNSVIREMLAGAVLHDKVSPEQLKSPSALAEHMRASLNQPLDVAHELGKGSKKKSAHNPSYKWLERRELFEDFRDAAALVVTMADAVRMRGNRLHDSSGAQMAIHRSSGSVLHFKVDKMGVRRPTLVYSDSYARGDAAIRSAKLGKRSIQISLQPSPNRDAKQTAQDAAFQVTEIMNDTIGRMLDMRGAKAVPLVLHPAPGETRFAHNVLASLPERYRNLARVGKEKGRMGRTRKRQRKRYQRGSALTPQEQESVLALMERGGLPLGKASNKDRLRQGLSNARRVRVASRTELFALGDKVDYVFVLAKGNALLSDGAGQALRLREGAILGQIAATSVNLGGSHAKVSVRRKKGVELIAIPKRDYQRYFAPHYHDTASLEAAVK